MKRIYICHPFASDPVGNAEACRVICERIVSTTLDILPVAPQVYLPQFMSDSTARKRAMACCISLLETCEAVWVMGDTLSPGMREELEAAQRRGIPLRFFSSLDAALSSIETKASSKASLYVDLGGRPISIDKPSPSQGELFSVVMSGWKLDFTSP